MRPACSHQAMAEASDARKDLTFPCPCATPFSRRLFFTAADCFATTARSSDRSMRLKYAQLYYSLEVNRELLQQFSSDSYKCVADASR
jgi:hypothetical protein